MISSPGRHSRAAVRVSVKLSVVMFAPKIVSSGEQRRNSAATRRDCVTSASVRRLVSYGPLTFAFDSRRYREIASMTESGTCVPPGPSKKASGCLSAEKRARTVSTSNVTVDIADTLLRFVREPCHEGADRPRDRNRPRRAVERRRGERQPQHVRRRCLCARRDVTGSFVRAGDVDCEPDPRQRARDRLVGTQGSRRALLGRAAGARADDGAPGTRLSRSSSTPLEHPAGVLMWGNATTAAAVGGGVLCPLLSGLGGDGAGDTARAAASAPCRAAGRGGPAAPVRGSARRA